MHRFCACGHNKCVLAMAHASYSAFLTFVLHYIQPTNIHRRNHRAGEDWRMTRKQSIWGRARRGKKNATCSCGFLEALVSLDQTPSCIPRLPAATYNAFIRFSLQLTFPLVATLTFCTIISKFDHQNSKTFLPAAVIISLTCWSSFVKI